MNEDAAHYPSRAVNEDAPGQSAGLEGNSPSTGMPMEIADSEDEQTSEVPDYIRAIVGSDVLDDANGSEYSADDDSDNRQPRRFFRASRSQGQLDKLRDSHVGLTVKILDRISLQVQYRDDGESADSVGRELSLDEFLLTEMNATSTTLRGLELAYGGHWKISQEAESHSSTAETDAWLKSVLCNSDSQMAGASASLRRPLPPPPHSPAAPTPPRP
jgi:hypothetical protein